MVHPVKYEAPRPWPYKFGLYYGTGSGVSGPQCAKILTLHSTVLTESCQLSY